MVKAVAVQVGFSAKGNRGNPRFPFFVLSRLKFPLKKIAPCDIIVIQMNSNSTSQGERND